ncbi:hypothetical protein SNC70_01715, partial [Escherichia coli]|nr:hypothetical protein [Escherichia coli]
MRLFRRNDIEIELHFSSGEDKVKSIKVKLRHAGMFRRVSVLLMNSLLPEERQKNKNIICT